MKNLLKIVAGFVAVIVLAVIIGGSSLWSHRNTAVAMEERIDAQYVSNKSNYDNMWKKFKELTQVTELQAEQFKATYTDLISSRNKDTGLLFKAIQEQNPQLNTEVYAQLQREIIAGRNQFDKNQSTIVDIIREYNTYIRQKVIMASITGREAKDANKYIVISQRTDDSFKTGKDDEVKLKDTK